MTLQEQAVLTTVEPCSFQERRVLLTHLTSGLVTSAITHTPQIDTLRLVYALKAGLNLAAQDGLRLTDIELLDSDLEVDGVEDNAAMYIADLLDYLGTDSYREYCQTIYTTLFLRDNTIRMKLPTLFGYSPNNNGETA